MKEGSYQLPAGALALLVHAVFFLLLYISFNWQMQKPQGMVVEIWESLPEVADEPQQVAEAPPRQDKIVTQTEKIVQSLPPKVEVAPEQESKAEIELKDKKKKLKKEQEVKEAIAKKQLAEKRAEQAERRLEEAERQVQERSRSQRKVQAEVAAASGKVIDEYVGRIRAKIKGKTVWSESEKFADIKAKFNVTLLPSGEVLSATLTKSSGNDAYDNAVERAILKAQPLPLPPAELNLFSKFRELHLTFSPAESR
jgi:colicin import membrane protein